MKTKDMGYGDLVVFKTFENLKFLLAYKIIIIIVVCRITQNEILIHNNIHSTPVTKNVPFYYFKIFRAIEITIQIYTYYYVLIWWIMLIFENHGTYSDGI